MTIYLTMLLPRYVDGEIVREGVVGGHDDGAFSTGRGGAANVGSPGIKPTMRHDREMIPEVAIRSSQDEAHVGRGGAGNVHHSDGSTTPPHPIGLADKLKNKLFKSKAKQESAAT
jgi:hypothetical protein